MQRLMKQNTDVILLVRSDGQILDASEAAAAAYGYSREELLNLRVQDLRAPHTLESLSGQFVQSLSEDITFETEHVRKDGSTFPVEVRSCGLPQTGARLSIIRDIPARSPRPCGAQQGDADRDEAEEWGPRIRSALSQRRLMLYFQSVVRLTDEQVTHHEVLVRLRAEDGSVIPASVFIPHAERLGLTPQIDRWVVGEVFRSLQADSHLRVFVNLSGQSLGDEELLAFIEEQARLTEVGERIGFEITETAMVQDLQAVESWMWRMKRLGCRFSLDDFGIGFTSFAYLRTLPVDYVKLDKSFMLNLATDAVNRSLVLAMQTMLQALGLQAVAEGVESGDVLDRLRELQVEYGQGYHWGRPGPCALAGTAVSA